MGGLFSRDTENPNAMFADPNNPFYKTATANFYKNLSKTLSANTPGKATLLAMEAAGGGNYGGSSYVAKKLSENLQAQNRDVASAASQQFQTNLFTEGMKLVSQGNLAKYQDNNSFANQLMTLGGGLFSRMFNGVNIGDTDGNGIIPTGEANINSKAFSGKINSPYAGYDPRTDNMGYNYSKFF